MKRIAIIAAMDEEKNEIEKKMKEIRSVKVYEKEFLIGKIHNIECILAKSGVGKVNAGRTTQMLIDKFDIDAIINVGSAGALNTELNFGDVVIGSSCVQHDFDITCFNHPKGYITDLGDEFKSDEYLVKKFQNILKNNIIKDGKVVVGKIATGDQFYNSPNIKQELRKQFNAECDDMESAAISQICFLCNKPFIALRSISDKPEKEEKVDFYNYLELASKQCADCIDIFMKEESEDNHDRGNNSIWS